MMNPNILNQNPLMFFDRAVNAQRSQLLTVMAEAVSECRTAADQAAELNDQYVVDNSVSVLVGRLRKKIEAAGERPYIQNVFGLGYRMEEE